ncbi:hypothetical protein BHE74_00023234 [Ensete ventricosum]|nr:hypothetical protein GW17_00030802 [Ensete ventricosum]RWW69198.1 hypothetical protein BHE74_00023234 [Ensete ventricosum]RZR83353.1 hypothetical protein BHM03_00009945 [Ensete ventricosum]
MSYTGVKFVFALKYILSLLQVRVVSPDKDFFQILSPSLRILRIASRGSGLVF